MKQKNQKKYIYEGLGFPVELKNVSMRFVRGDWHPVIDVDAIANAAIKELIFQKQRFSGNQIKFIRSYLGMSLREFQDVVSETHTAIAKWEKKASMVTNMDLNIEKNLRLYLRAKFCTRTKKEQHDFFEAYEKIQALPFDNAQCPQLELTNYAA